MLHKTYCNFLLTNISILLVLSISIYLLLLERFFTTNHDLDPDNLLVFAAIAGFTGFFISLATSKRSVRFVTGVRIIEQDECLHQALVVDGAGACGNGSSTSW